MAAPLLPQWDSNTTHTTPTVAGHKTDGYASNEVPPSDELNYWMNLVYQNLAHLTAQGGYLPLLSQFILRADGSAPADPEYTGAALPTDSIYALAPNPGMAFLKQGSANNKVKIAPGTLLQLASSKLLAYTFDGTTEYTIANGDPSNPRVDILQMQIGTDSSQNPTVAVNVKQGTPAASPTYPAPDAGYCVIAGIVVGTNYVAAAGFKHEDTAGAVAILHDQRLPLRVRSHVTPPSMAVPLLSAAAFTPTNNLVTKANNLAVDYDMPLHNSVSVGRLVAVSIGIRDPSALTSQIGKMKLFEASGVSFGFTPLTGASVNGTSSGQFHMVSGYAYQWAQAHAPAAGPTVQPYIGGGYVLGVPIWTNGKYSPDQPLQLGSFPIPYEVVGLHYSAPANNTYFGPATFFVAGGL